MARSVLVLSAARALGASSSKGVRRASAAFACAGWHSASRMHQSASGSMEQVLFSRSMSNRVTSAGDSGEVGGVWMTGPSDPLRGHPARPRVQSLQRSPPGAAHPPPAPRDERTDVELEREHHTPRAELREGADAVPSQAADRTARSRRSASTRARPARRDRQAPGCVPRSEPHPGIWLMAARIDAFGGEWSDGVCVAGALFDSRRVRAAGLQFGAVG